MILAIANCSAIWEKLTGPGHSHRFTCNACLHVLHFFMKGMQVLINIWLLPLIVCIRILILVQPLFDERGQFLMARSV